MILEGTVDIGNLEVRAGMNNKWFQFVISSYKKINGLDLDEK